MRVKTGNKEELLNLPVRLMCHVQAVTVIISVSSEIRPYIAP